MTPPAIARTTSPSIAALAVDVDALAERLRIEEPVDHEVRYAHAAVRGRVGRHRVAAVDGVAADEVHRVPENAERAPVPARHLPVDREPSLGRVVAGDARGRSGRDQHDLPAA